jgi:hypothetical protein
MADLNSLLDAAANAAAPPAPVNAPQSLDATSARIQQQLSFLTPDKQASIVEKVSGLTQQSYYPLAVAASRQSNAGLASASPVEHDLRTMDPVSFVAKYGDEGQKMLDRYVSATRDVGNQDARSRDLGQILGDSANSLGTGLASTLGSFGALGAHVIDPKLGASIAQSLGDWQNTQQGYKSQTAQDSASQVAALDSLTSRDNQAQFEKEKAASPGSVETSLNALDAALGYKSPSHDVVATLRREGRNVLDSVGHQVADPTAFGEGASNAVGSLLATGPVAKVIGATGKAILPETARLGLGMSADIARATGTNSASRLLDAAVQAGEKYVPGSLAIGAMEGAGAYQQTAADVMNTDPATLAQQSPAFNKLVAGGMTPEDARATLAGNEGATAAKWQAPAGVLTGALVAPFEAHPFKLGGVRTALQNVGKEALEEGTQNATGQVAQNYAESQGSNPAQDLLDSVGQQFGQGALYGAAAAGHVAAPGVALGAAIRAPLGAATLAAKGIGAGVDAARNSPAIDQIRAGLSTLKDAGSAVAETGTGLAGAAGSALGSLVQTAKPYVSKVTDYFANRGDAVMKQNEQDSPVADETVAQAAQDMQATAPSQAEALRQSVNDTPDLSPEAKARANDYLDQASKITELSPEQVAQWHPAAQQAVGDATNRFTAIQNMQAYLQDTEHPEADRLAVAAQLEQEKADIGRFADANPHALDDLPQGHEARAFADDVATFAKGVESTPGMARADRAAKTLVDRAADIIKPLTEQRVQTPEGLADAKTIANLAEVAPQKLDLPSVQIALKHATSIGLNDPQRRALLAAAALLKTAQTHFDELTANGDKPLSPQDLVAKNVAVEDAANPFQKSALGHAQTIRSAYRSGDLDGARSQLLDLQKFAQSQQNKLAAINGHLATAKDGVRSTVHYETLSANADRSFGKSKEGVFVNPTSKTSVALARRVASEAKFLTDLHNHLSTAFPELNVEHLTQTPLDSRLADGSLDDVVREFKDGTRSAKSTPVQAKSQAPQQTVTPAEPKVATREAAPAPTSKPVEQAPVEVKAEVKTTEPVKADAAPVVKPEAKPAEKVGAAPVAEQKQGLAAAYPQLIEPKAGGNQFTQAFRPARGADENTPPSNVVLHEEPVQAIADSVKQAIRAMPEEFSKDVWKGYATAFRDIDRILGTLRDNLDKFLTDKRVGERFLNEEGKAAHAHRWVDGKLLNLTENVDGRLQYNEQLLQGAALAGMTWFLGSGQLGNVFDAQHASELTGVPVGAVDDTLVTRLKGSIGTTEALDSLAAKIQQYWGVRANRDAPIGYTEGIPLSMAAEVLRALQEHGLIDTDKIWVDTSENGGLIDPTKDTVESEHVKSINRILPVKLDKEDAIRKFPDLIEKSVLTKSTPTYYFDDQRPDVARRQMRNEYVKNTGDQLSALKNEQDTPHFLNPTMASLYHDMTEAVALRWFGAGDLEGRALNDNHKASLAGQNMTIRAAYREFQNLHAAIEATAQEQGVAPEDVPNHYGYNMSRVGRMQMLGKYNPQSTKLIREVMLPTRATLDLTDAKHMQAFELGLAQALGIKVHNLAYADIHSKLDGLLNGVFAPAVEHFQKWLKDEAPLATKTVEDAFTAAGQDISPLALHALTEYARFQNASAEERAKFTTTKYLEADGMTNGPVNAMALLSTGPFTADWVSNMRRGGLEIGGTAANTSSAIRSTPDGAADLYQATTDRLRSHLADLNQSLKSQGNDKVLQQQRHLMNLMDMFLPDLDIKDGKLEIGRGIAKNPLTITIYGSGANGIAAKMVGGMVDAIYERMSAAAQRMADAEEADQSVTPAEAFFPDDPLAEEKWAKFNQRINALIDSTAVYSSKKGQHYLIDTPAGENSTVSKGFTKFTFTPQELKNMSANMRTLFVDPLRGAIKDVVGDLEKSTNLIRQATQTQSIFMQHLFLQGVESALQAKEKANPDFGRDEFLSSNELNKVMESLAVFHPLVQTKDQSFFVAGSQNSGVDTTDFGRALDGSFRATAFVYGPANAGVAGIPFLNIGMGDGKMMQNLANDPRVRRTLKIFDGMNMPLDSITEQSQAANEAVLDSWRGNPMQAVSEAWGGFMKSVSSKLDLAKFIASNPELHDQLAKSLFGLGSSAKDVDVADIVSKMEATSKALQESALQIEARHNVMDRVNLSVDQMAAAGAPHVVDGKIQISGTDEEKAAQLANLYAEELEKLRAKAKTEEPVQQGVPVEQPEAAAANTQAAESADIAKQVNSLGRVDKSTGVRVLSTTAVNKIRTQAGIPEHQAAILKEIPRSLGAKGYKVISGTPEQLAKFAFNQSDTAAAFGPGVKGLTLPQSQRIYLINPSAETLTHELIHASTFETVHAFYQGSDLGANAAVVKDTIGRIETMMGQFLELDVSKESEAAQQAHADAVAAIHSVMDSSAEGKASALNEFMAWALASKDLAELGKKTVVSSLVQMAKDVFKAIRQLVYGRKQVPVTPGADMFSNLLFNSAVLMRTQPSVAQALRSTVLYQNSNYGTNPRLVELNKSFAGLLDSFSRQPMPADVASTGQAQANFAKVQAAGLALQVQAHGFPMSMQEASTFSLIAAALGTQAHIDPSSMARAQELYQHVTKNLMVEHFMKTDPQLDDPNDRYQAQQKYNMVMGDFGTSTDKAGRSSLMPVFLGLAMVNDDFRSVLQKMDLPKGEKSAAKSRLDAMLENLGMGLMGRLSDLMAGDTKSSNVRDSIDSLMRHVQDVAHDRESFMRQTWAGDAVDSLNATVVQGVERVTDKIIDSMQQVIDDPAASPLSKNLAKYAQVSARMATEKNGNKVAESVVALMNRANAWQPLHDLVYDFVGRTDENAPVYDMTKAVRAEISQDRQNYREHVPGIIADQFSRPLEDSEWSMLHRALGRTDIAALRSHFSHEDIQGMLGDAKTLDKAINDLEGKVQQADPANWNLYQKKMQQLAKFQMTGKVGTNLLRNAEAISRLFLEKSAKKTGKRDADFIRMVDHLTSLYALEQLSPTEKGMLASLVQQESAGLKFTTDYLVGQRAEEQRKAEQSPRGRINGFKGYIPEQQKTGVHLMVADDANYQALTERSYVRVADYKGSSADGLKGRMGYYFAPVSSRTLFNQGIFQNVRQSVNGVDIGSGFNNSSMIAGRITDRAEVARTALNLARGESGMEPLMPVFDEKGVPVAFERSIDPQQAQRAVSEQNLAQMIGVWRGRQVEEAKAQEFNNALIDALHARYEADIRESASNQKEYVNLSDPRELAKDPVIADAVKLMTPETRQRIKAVFGDHFYVSRDMLHDAMGYRNASVGDVFTGNSRWSPETQEYMKRVMIGMFGNKAYQYFTNAEKTLQNFIGDAKTLIVVKSVVVPVTNMLGNMLQLVGRGVPIKHIAMGAPRKIAETNFYVKGRQQQIQLEAQMRTATEDPVATRKLSAQWQSIEDSFKRLSIHPLIQAGEFTGISDASRVGSDDIALTSGKVQSYLEAQVDKLPKALQTAGRYALVTKDTALFKGLQKSVEYGDFIAKALLYDDLTKRQNKSSAYALSRVTEEFVNYDKLPGRFRGYLESMGLLWFYNFKIRAAKVAMSMVRNNPVHSLLAASVPIPHMFGSVGTPLGDNFFTKLMDGGLTHSFGVGQVFHAPMMNPWVNIFG